MADPGEGPGGGGAPPLFWVKKEEITEGKKASRTRNSRPLPSPLAQSLDPPLEEVVSHAEALWAHHAILEKES